MLNDQTGSPWTDHDQIYDEKNNIIRNITEMGKNKLILKKGDNAKFGYVDENDKWVIEPKFDYAYDLRDDDEPSIVVLNGKYGFINSDGSYLAQPIYDDAWSFNFGLARVKLYNKWGIMKNDGTYQEEKCFHEVKKGDNNLFGFTDKDGNWIIEPMFDHIYPWQQLYVVVKDQNWGYFNKQGEFLQPLYYDEIKPVKYSDEVLVGWENGEGTYIQPDGEVDYIDEDDEDSESNSMIEW